MGVSLASAAAFGLAGLNDVQKKQQACEKGATASNLP
jgi:hypothetical protein